MGMVFSGSPLLHTILEVLPSEDNSVSCDEESRSCPIPWECNVVTSVIPIATTPPTEETPALRTMPAVP
jgi:hypothetical protein